MLTEQQITQFHTFGFLVLRNIITEDEHKIVSEEVEKGYANKDKSEFIGGERLQLNWTNLVPISPYLTSLLENPRFYGIAQQLMGDDAVGFDTTSNIMKGDRTTWHPDAPPNLQGLKFTFYLDRLDGESGALRLIPGSHQVGFSDAIREVRLKDNNPGPPEDPGLAINEVPCHVCETGPRDAVIMNYLNWHASWHGSSRRRMVALKYYKNPKSPDETEALRIHFKGAIEDRKNNKLTINRTYSESWLSNPENSPVRARWINWLREWGLIDEVAV